MALILENISGAQLQIDDLGFGLSNGGTIDLTLESDPSIVATSADTGGDLNAAITSGSVVIKDPLDNVTNLSTANAIIACRVHNDTHYRMPVGGRIPDISDVNVTPGPGIDGFALTYNNDSSEWQASAISAADELVKTSSGDGTPGYLDTKLTAGTSITLVESGTTNRTITIDTTIPLSNLQTEIDNIESSLGPSVNTNGTWNGFSGTLYLNSAASITDALELLDTELGNLIVGDVASVTVGLIATSAIPTTWGNVSWPTTHVENNTSIIEHDNTNTDRILIKETGLYLIGFSISFDADPSEETIECRILIDDATVVPGSLRLASEDDEINDLSNIFTAELTAGSYLTLQTRASGGGNLLHLSSNFMVTRAAGTKGAVGPTGSGTNINVQDDDLSVPNTPHSILNFGSGLTATNNGSGKVTIDTTGFDSHHQEASTEGSSSTSSQTYQQKVTMTTSSLTSGKYRIGWYAEVINTSTSGRTFVRVQVNDTITLCEPSVETEDTRDWVPFSGYKYETMSGVNVIDLDYKRQTNGTSSIRRSRLEIWRVS